MAAWHAFSIYSHEIPTDMAFEKVRDCAERALELDDTDARIHALSATAYLHLGEHELTEFHTEKAMRLDPFYPDSRLEALFDAYYMAGDYGKAVDSFRRWRNPPAHMYAEFAAALAKLGRTDAARVAVDTYDHKRPREHDASEFAKRHSRICKLEADREYWLEGYREAGFDV